jgi:hypothetical protein
LSSLWVDLFSKGYHLRNARPQRGDVLRRYVASSGYFSSSIPGRRTWTATSMLRTKRQGLPQGNRETGCSSVALANTRQAWTLMSQGSRPIRSAVRRMMCVAVMCMTVGDSNNPVKSLTRFLWETFDPINTANIRTTRHRPPYLSTPRGQHPTIHRHTPTLWTTTPCGQPCA